VIRTLIALVAAALAAPALGQFLNPQSPQKPVHPEPGPGLPGLGPALVQGRIEFDRLVHDFGKIFDTGPVETTFTFTNRGIGMLRINNVHGSCGCTVPALTKNEYAPGESGTIRVSFNPHGRKGPQQTTVTITTNQESNPISILTIKSEVLKVVEFDPPYAAFGQLNRGESKTLTVQVIGRNPDFEITGASGLDERYFAYEIGKPESFQDNEGTRFRRIPVTVTFKGTAPVGFINQALTVRTNDPRPSAQLVTLNVMAQVMSALTPNPQAVSLGVATVGGPVKGEFRVSNRLRQPFTISKVEGIINNIDPNHPTAFPEPLTFEVVPAQANHPKDKPATDYTIRFSGVAPTRNGQLRGEFVIHSDLPDEPELRVPFFGNILLSAPVNYTAPPPLKSGEVILTPAPPK
jgi:hypothetical protein